jgi:hypothetical protein
MMLMLYWFEPILYLDPAAKFPETTEKPWFFVGFADNVCRRCSDIQDP